MKKTLFILIIGILICLPLRSAYSLQDDEEQIVASIRVHDEDGTDYIYDESRKDSELKIEADVDGDGKDEMIWSFTTMSDDDVRFHLCVTAIYEVNGDEQKLVKTILNGERPDELYAADFDNDGAKEIVLMTNAGMHWTEVNVYQYQNGDYVSIFTDETASGVIFVEDIKLPLIKVGRPGGKANWSYADEPLWKVYKWGEQGFEISKDLSSPKLKYYYPEELEKK